MNTIPAVLALPNKCPVDQIQGKVVQVYAQKTINDKAKQDFLLADAAGNKIMCGAWEHADLSFYKDKEIIINAGPKGGLTVNVYNNKTGLNVSRTCTFQLLAVHQAQGGATTPTEAPKPANQAQSVSAAPSNAGLASIHPATVGMCINQACAELIQAGQPLSKAAVWKTASMLVKVALHMEKGNLYEEAKAPEPAPAPQPEQQEDSPF